MFLVKYIILASVGVNMLINAQEETKPDKVFEKRGALCQKLKLKNGRVKYRFRGRQASFRCRSGFSLIGRSFSVCLGRDWSHPVPICAAPTCPSFADLDKDNLHVTTWYAGALLKFTCPPGFEIEGSSILLCDGRSWNGTTPACQYIAPENSAASVACDFEENMCGWFQDTSDDNDWRRHTGQTPSSYTGPVYDHTTNSSEGFYIYLESSDTAAGQRARLITRVLAAETQERCFQFWYHMHGPSPKLMGDLNIYIKPVGLPEVLLFHQNGSLVSLSDQWRHGSVQLPEMLQAFQIVIEAVDATHYAGSYVSDIAVDDVSLTTCPIEQPSTFRWPTPYSTTKSKETIAASPSATTTTPWTTLTPFTPTFPSSSSSRPTTADIAPPAGAIGSTTASTSNLTVSFRMMSTENNSATTERYTRTKYQGNVSTTVATPTSITTLSITTTEPNSKNGTLTETVSAPSLIQGSQSDAGKIKVRKSTESNNSKQTLIYIIMGIVGGSFVVIFFTFMSIRYVSQRCMQFGELSLHDDLHPIASSAGTPGHSSNNSRNHIEMF